jgi:hypothetical protein
MPEGPNRPCRDSMRWGGGFTSWDCKQFSWPREVCSLLIGRNYHRQDHPPTTCSLGDDSQSVRLSFMLGICKPPSVAHLAGLYLADPQSTCGSDRQAALERSTHSCTLTRRGQRTTRAARLSRSGPSIVSGQCESNVVVNRRGIDPQDSKAHSFRQWVCRNKGNKVAVLYGRPNVTAAVIGGSVAGLRVQRGSMISSVALVPEDT